MNSGYYYIPHKINTTNQAFAVLGQKKVKEILVNFTYHDFLQEFENVSKKYKIKFYLFIYVSAYISKMLAKIKGSRNTLYLFSQMIFRHIGIFFLPDLDDKFIKKLIKMLLNKNFKEIYRYEESKFGFNHLEITEYLLNYWNFEADFIEETIKPFKNDYFSKLILFSEKIAINLIEKHKNRGFKKLIEEFEKKILISGDILIDVFYKLKNKLEGIAKELEINRDFVERIDERIDILEKKGDDNLKEIVLKLNKRENKLHRIDNFIEKINRTKREESNLNPLKYFLKTFNKYFDFDRMFYFENVEKNKFKLKEFVGEKKFNDFVDKKVKIDFNKYDKQVLDKNDKVNLKKFKKLLGNSNYLIFPLVIQDDTQAFLLLDNYITRKEFDDKLVDEIKEFLQYSQVIFFDLYYNKYRNIQTMLEEIHKLGVSFNHMINNSLTVILTSTNILSGKLEKQKNLKHLQKIKNATDRISEYLEKFREIDNLKDLSYLQGINMYELDRDKKGEDDESV